MDGMEWMAPSDRFVLVWWPESDWSGSMWR